MSVVSLSIENAVKGGICSLLDMACEIGDEEVKAFYAAVPEKKGPVEKHKEIDITPIQDLGLRRLIAQFVYDELKDRTILVKGFHELRVMPLIEIIQNYPEIWSMNSEEFIAWVAEIQNEYPNLTKRIKKVLTNIQRHSGKHHCFECDEWMLSWFQIASERQCKSTNRTMLVFKPMKNEKTLFLIKKYIWYLLTKTDKSIATIAYRKGVLQGMVGFYNKDFDQYSPEDATVIIDNMRTKGLLRKTISSYLIIMNEFVKFLIIHDYIEKNPFSQYRSLMWTGAYEYKTTAPDMMVVTQIFNVLDKIEDKSLVIWYLILFCTGLRRSEATELTKDCIGHHGDRYYIMSYSSKMRKNQQNEIPIGLYQLIKDYRETIPGPYLFPSPKDKSGNKIITSAIMALHLQEELIRLGVKNPDGTPYRFKAHSYRHLMAVRMREENVSFLTIVEQLHHESPEMTLAYLEYIDKQAIKKMKEFIDTKGNRAPIQLEIPETTDEEYVQYMSKFLIAQRLPNGICARPVKLGACPHANSCLTCPEFRTSLEDLKVHKEQYAHVCEYLKTAEENGWLPQVKTNQCLKTALETIISRLESINEEGE